VVSLVLLSLLAGCNSYGDLAADLSPLLRGNQVSAAAIYDPSDPGPHRILLLDTSGEPHKWNNKLPEEWLPTEVNEAELVALVEPESEIHLGTQNYSGGPPITRYRYEIGIQILEAHTGTVLWSGTVKGSQPPGFPATAPKEQKKLLGSHVSSEDLVAWLSCKITSVDCDLRILEGSPDTRYWLSLAFSPDGQTLAAIPATPSVAGGLNVLGGANRVSLWRLVDGVQIDSFGMDSSARSIAFSPDGSILAVRTADGTLYLWQVKTGSLLRTMRGHENEDPCVFSAPLMPLAFSSDGQSLTVAGCEVTELWRVSDGELLNMIIPGGNVFDAAISDDGQFSAVRTNTDAVIYHVQTGAVVPGPWFDGDGVVFSPNKQTLAVGDTRTRHPDGSVQLRQISSGDLLGELFLEDVDGTVGYISMAFSPDGQFLATKQSSGGLELWRIQDSSLLHTLDEPVSFRYLTEIAELEFSPDGQFLAFTNGSHDGIIRILWTGEILK